MDLAGAAHSAYRRLEKDLQRGLYAPGSRLPGERSLAASLGVSRVTVRKALTELAAQGSLERSAQRGWFVPRQSSGEAPSLLRSFTEMALERGLTPRSKVVTQRIRPAQLEEATKLRIAPTAPVVELVRIRFMEGVAVCTDSTILPLAVAAPLAEVDMTNRSLYAELERLCGHRVQRSSYSMQAKAAGPADREYLGLDPGQPILVARDVAYDADGVPLVLGVTHYRGDAYRFEADLFRP